MFGLLAVLCLLRYASADTPKTCQEILQQNRNANSGVYALRQGGADVKAYCYMGEICGSKGWTMIMKIDGSKDTFRYDSPYWSNKNVFNVAGADGGLNNQETKLQTYSTMSFNKLCLGMKTGSETRWLTLRETANSLYSLIADGKYRPTHYGREAWKSLIKGSSLQRNCNLEGFNVNPIRQTRARIGMIGNQENDCRSPDSRIGFGTNGNWCRQNDRNSAGNEARCAGDNGDKSIMSFGYIFAQEKVDGAPLGSYDSPASSCDDLASIKDAKSGVYYLKDGNSTAIKAYCYMEELCGSKGWTMIMKIDGSKTTFTYNSPYWTNDQGYNLAGADGGLSTQETKLQTYSTTPFNKLCLGMQTKGVTRWMPLRYPANSLHSLIADGKYRATHNGRGAWKSLIDGSSLQYNCNQEGFNVNANRNVGARIGIIGNNENDCRSPDSRIGFGTHGSYCGQNYRNSAGNEARCSPDNGHKSIMSFGYIFAKIAPRNGPLGSFDNPASSCKQIKANITDAKSGVYYLSKEGKAMFKAYCYMEELCGSTGWTMIMKIDGSKTTFHYNSAYWANEAPYNLAGADGGLDNTETKLKTYSMTSFDKLCLGFKRNGVTRWMSMEYKAKSLHSLIADGQYRPTYFGRESWKSLISGSSLQPHCNREGFNVLRMARIGIVANQENDCNSPDSRLGLGTAGSGCGQNNRNSAGNEARCSADNGDKSIMVFGYIFAKELSGEALLGSRENPAPSCTDIKAARSGSQSGVYYLKRGQTVVKAYCYMAMMCGSRAWTMIMKIDGSKTTFSYDSKYWTNNEGYNLAGADGGLDNQETKLQTYSTVSFSKLCLGFKSCGETRWMTLRHKADSLHSVIADGNYRETSYGRYAWKRLIRASSLQRSCTREGFNVLNMARIGIVSSQDSDCKTPESRIGLGTAGSYCNQDGQTSAGNEARCGSDNGDQSIKSFGYIFAQEQSEEARLGSFEKPALSCTQIRSDKRESRSGVYYLKRGDVIIKAYCYMEEICGSRGWTMVMKIDGNKNTFHYKSPYWTNNEVYNVASAYGDLDNTETKLQTYSTVSFDRLCLGMKTGSETRWLSLDYKANSLYSVIADNKYRPTSKGRDAWKKLVSGSSLQPNCNREGFNVLNMARIGIVSNQENNCNSPESRIGFGTGGSSCGQNDKNSAGNEARCGGDNGNKSIKGFGYIFVQEMVTQQAL